MSLLEKIILCEEQTSKALTTASEIDDIINSFPEDVDNILQGIITSSDNVSGCLDEASNNLAELKEHIEDCKRLLELMQGKL